MGRSTDRAPLVAVSGGDQEARWGAWNDYATLVPSAYMRAVQSAGGVPVLVAESARVDVVAERVDALLLTGGGDLDPSLYGQVAHPKTQAPDEGRDSFEISLLGACILRDMPVLAVCRGLQVLNIARGGTLHQHVPDEVGHIGHLPETGTFSLHAVRIDPRSRLFDILGRENVEVPTHHHQAIDRIGRGLQACAWADDGLIEAAEDSDHRFLVGVQWHPEAGEDPSVFRALVSAACSKTGESDTRQG